MPTDRTNAVRSWELTQASELLQRVGAFNGVLITCTNRFDSIDPAMRRRFHRRITMLPLAVAQIGLAAEVFFHKIKWSNTALTSLKKHTGPVVADFAIAADYFDVCDEQAVESDAIARQIFENAAARSTSRQVGFQL